MIFDEFSANGGGFVGGFLRVTPILRRNSYRNSLNVYILYSQKVIKIMSTEAKKKSYTHEYWSEAKIVLMSTGAKRKSYS